MLKFYPERPRPAAFRVVGDLAVGTWTVICLLLGRWLHDQIERLRQVGDALRGTGDEINSGIGQLNTGFGQLNEVLKAIKDSPLSQLLNLHNPPALPSLARRGDQLIAAAGQLNTVVDQTALVVGVLVAAIPILLITVPYAVWRWRDARERGAALAYLDRAAAGGLSEQASALLAFRAVSTLSFTRLMRVSRDPVSDLLEHRYEALADEMLRSTGLQGDRHRRPERPPTPEATSRRFEPPGLPPSTDS